MAPYDIHFGHPPRGRRGFDPRAGRLLRSFRSDQRPGPNWYRGATDYGARYGSNYAGGRYGRNFYGGAYGADFFAGRPARPYGSGYRLAYDRDYGRYVEGDPRGGNPVTGYRYTRGRPSDNAGNDWAWR